MDRYYNKNDEKYDLGLEMKRSAILCGLKFLSVMGLELLTVHPGKSKTMNVVEIPSEEKIFILNMSLTLS